METEETVRKIGPVGSKFTDEPTEIVMPEVVGKAIEREKKNPTKKRGFFGGVSKIG